MPVRVQLLGSDPHFMALNAARLVALNPAGIDLNFGCPAKTVNRHGGGAILLREPEKIRELVAAVRAAIPPDMPLTAKMRLGYEDKNLAARLRPGHTGRRRSRVVVHARTKVEVTSRLRIGSGSAAFVMRSRFLSSRTARYGRSTITGAVSEASGVEDVMLGRGIVANPALARLIRGEAAIGWSELQPLLQVFWEQVKRHTQRKYYCGRMKQWLNFLRQTYPEAEAAFQCLRTVTEPDELERWLSELQV